jgi:hypothetical protein
VVTATEAGQTPVRPVAPLQRLSDSIMTALRPLAETVSAASARFGAWYAEHEDAIN